MASQAVNRRRMMHLVERESAPSEFSDIGGSFPAGDRRPPTASSFRDRIAIGAPLVLAVFTAACMANGGHGSEDGLGTVEPAATVVSSTTVMAPAISEAPAAAVVSSTTVMAPAISEAPDACARPLETYAPMIPLGEADVDGDGDDEGLLTDGEGREVWVRTAPDRFSAPSAVHGSGVELLDAADLDSDGDEELFVNTGGNTAQGGVLLDWDGDVCALRAVADPDHAYLDWQYLYDGWGFSCMPTGCYLSITCVTNDGIVEIIESMATPSSDLMEKAAADWDSLQEEDYRLWWSWRRLRLVDGELEILGSGQGGGHMTDGPLMRGVACSSWLRGAEGCGESPMVVDTLAWWELEGGWLPLCEAPAATP